MKAAPLPSLAQRVRLVVMVELLPLALAVAGVVVVGIHPLGVALFVVMYVLTMFGVELGMHRVIAHRQLRATAPVRALLCILGAMAGEGSPLLWGAIHREHHRSPDDAGDPHSPLLGRKGAAARMLGFIWAQSLWYTEVPGILRFQRTLRRKRAGLIAESASPGDTQATELLDVVKDWLVDPLVVRLDVLYSVWIVVGFVVPAAVGALVAGQDGALQGLVWGGVVRFVAVQKVSFAINSVSHTIGVRSMQTQDGSRNNVVMAVLTLGSGWHNNHHAFPGAAVVQFRWWQFDPCGWAVLALARLLPAIAAWYAA